MLSAVKRAFPASLKSRLSRAYRDRAFANLVRRLTPGAVPSGDELTRLRAAWGNEGFSADVAYLSQVCELALATDGPILECGSGLSTVLLSALAGGRGVPVTTLEHMPAWRDRVSGALRRCRLNAPQYDCCVLRSYGAFDWYELPIEFPPAIRLVICDGPPGSTRGGRVGLLPVCAARLAPGCVILLDDAERPEERAVIEQWIRDFRVTAEFVETGEGTFARLRMPA